MNIHPGTHLVVQRKGYTHHGIYVGNGRVVHYTGLSNRLESGPIQETSISVFSAGDTIKERRYKNPRFIGKKAVERALSRIGESDYDIHANNCEHFCSWVITGRSISQQVEIIEGFMDVFIPGMAVTSLVKARRHSKQIYDKKGVAKNIAEAGGKAAVATMATSTLPAIALYKAAKWLITK